jgi:hypothetical protein
MGQCNCKSRHACMLTFTAQANITSGSRRYWAHVISVYLITYWVLEVCGRRGGVGSDTALNRKHAWKACWTCFRVLSPRSLCFGHQLLLKSPEQVAEWRLFTKDVMFCPCPPAVLHCTAAAVEVQQGGHPHAPSLPSQPA